MDAILPDCPALLFCLSMPCGNYKDYLYEANRKMMTNIYNSYDNYVNQKYNFEINYQALENIKNYYK